MEEEIANTHTHIFEIYILIFPILKMLETFFGLLSLSGGTSGSEPQSLLMDGTLSKKSHTNHVDPFVERGGVSKCLYKF